MSGVRDPRLSATLLLRAWSHGDRAAFDQLVPLVHAELRRLAGRQMRHERPGHTLQASALVNEAYLRLIDLNRIEWHNRAHFLAIASRVMRRILVDSARARRCHKRGDGASKVSLDEALMVSKEPDRDVLAVDDALTALAAMDPRKGQVVEMRFFGGLSVAQTALALRVPVETVVRDWRLAKAWLVRELKDR